MHVQADLELEHRGFVYRLESAPGGLQLVLPSIASALNLLTADSLQTSLDSAEQLLRGVGQRVKIVYRGRTLGELGGRSWTVAAFARALSWRE